MWPFAPPEGTRDPGRSLKGAVGCPWAATQPGCTESKMGDEGGPSQRVLGVTWVWAAQEQQNAVWEKRAGSG